MTDLTKWPLLLVSGDRVTEEQANDILIRTNSPYLGANDKEWVRQVCAEFGVTLTERWGDPDWRSQDTAYTALGVLDLHYLHNSRIVSTWIGGAHGWCDWDGTIGCSNYNIGKWPSVEAVTEDWQTIASRFPFLSLRAQLVPDEGEAPGPVVEWIVDGGQVAMRTDGEFTQITARPLTDGDMMLRFLSPGGERGVSLERLRAALAQVRASVEV